MRVLLISAALLATAVPASAQSTYNNGQSSYGTSSGLYGTGSNSSTHTVSPYVNSQGTYVQPHAQTNPNNTQMDNYSTRGNYNPNTGTYGTRTPRY